MITNQLLIPAELIWHIKIVGQKAQRDFYLNLEVTLCYSTDCTVLSRLSLSLVPKSQCNKVKYTVSAQGGVPVSGLEPPLYRF